MPSIRVFNPAAYTPRSYFAGQGAERRTVTMAHHKHYHRRHHRHHHRHNPFGISRGVLTDAAWNTGGALGSLYLSGLFPQFSAGWTGVFATGGAALALGFGGKMFAGSKASEELLKGGLVATIIKALHQAGVAPNLGLGLYAPSWFSIPTASNQYAVSAAPGATFNRGAGTIFFPGPQAALPPAAAMSGMGYHRFRSRYAGNYGG
jgi:hypothetical protein